MTLPDIDVVSVLVNDGTLTAEGARYLRGARDAILAHPEQFDMGEWDCGTRACIAGHIARQVPSFSYGWSTSSVSNLLGFGYHVVSPHGHPLSCLFFDDMRNNDPVWAAARINEFLWQYGYAADEVAQEAVCTG